MKKTGISILNGDYLSGKSTMVGGILQSLLIASEQVKQKRELEKTSKVVKTYTIKELMENDSSDEEFYTHKPKDMTLFPWFKNNYTHINDDLDYNQQGLT